MKGPAHHYLHHKYKNGNYGGFPTGIWDNLCGTELTQDGRGRKTSRFANTTAAAIVKGCCLVSAVVQCVDEFEYSLWWCVLCIFLLWIALLDGALVIFPPERIRSAKKVFVVGLSRTGTTSITEALNILGLRVHHFCAPLVSNISTGHPTVNRAYSDAFDGHTDIATILVMEELSELYPNCKFIHTVRKKEEWSRAMVRFVSEEPRRTLFKTHPTPKKFYDAAYGPGPWWEYGLKEWNEVWEQHQTRIWRLQQRLQQQKNKDERFLEIDLTNLGKQGKHEEMWTTISAFLNNGTEADSEREAVVDRLLSTNTSFPHRYVFQYSAVDQPLRQMKYCLQRVSWIWIALLSCAVLFVRFYDAGQCTRACRVENGVQFGAVLGRSYPNVLGRRGNWFEPQHVTGKRLDTKGSTAYCSCSSSVKDLNLTKKVVPRLHPKIATKDQWWFNTERVCVVGMTTNNTQGKDGRTKNRIVVNYTNWASADSATLLKEKDQSAMGGVINCGQCGRCSTLQNVNAMHEKAKSSLSLTKRASFAAIGYILGGKRMHQTLFRSSFIGFDEACSAGWYEATRCNLASCSEYCLFGWENPLSTDSASGTDKKLNACMECDEVHCSAYYLQACGANRRTAGVVTDIMRPEEDVCEAARLRYEEESEN